MHLVQVGKNFSSIIESCLVCKKKICILPQLQQKLSTNLGPDTGTECLKYVYTAYSSCIHEFHLRNITKTSVPGYIVSLCLAFLSIDKDDSNDYYFHRKWNITTPV